jgi:RNA polymerase sigma-70 factor (ECF subfamily)
MEVVRTGLATLPSPATEIFFRRMDGMREELTYERLIAPIRERMMRIIWRIVRDPDEAEDTMQEVLTLIWKKLDRFSGHPNPHALVLKICVNTAIDTLRRRHRHRRFVDPQILDRLPASESGDGWECKETEAMVREAIGRLPRKQAAAVLLRVLEEQPYEEIARVLGCGENTARTHVWRGRIKLSRWLSHLRPSLSEEIRP